MQTEIVQTAEDENYIYLTSYYQGVPVRFYKNKKTNEICINADDALMAMGFNGTFIDYLGTDNGLDFINECRKNRPDVPFLGGLVKQVKQ